MPRENWSSVTLKKETLQKAREVCTVQNGASAEELLECTVRMIHRWRRNHIWANFHKPPEWIKKDRLRVETQED